jgi:hypothetical protein
MAHFSFETVGLLRNSEELDELSIVGAWGAGFGKCAA